MTLRRIVTGTLAGSALLGLSVVSGGVASASESHDGSTAPRTCTTTGTASDSPGVQSGNVTQIPVLDCSDVNASPTVEIAPVFGSAPGV
ncbi:chaplin family protein [Actinomycetospora chibensis]|uniref:Chaplin family protein n=1 Tax=Actinomycetospora chibensis TaxID=663606 RepID=A0ABV9RLG3_9PSEU|nr:chaplin family protein [Actinomycetospora chibensis]MDD7922708.1 chaplin family protein [Actinomycetospora chibensis]